MAAFRSGARVDRYELEEFVDRRSAGSIYRAYERSASRPVTIVFLNSLHSQASRQRFTSQASRLVSLHQSGVVEEIGFGTYEDSPYVVCEYVDGGSLADRLRGARMTAAEAARILDVIGQTLDDAHMAGIGHGDVNPANVLFTRRDEPVLFGLGLLPMQDAERIEDPAPWIAPEQAATGQTSGAADRYSFAALAYQLLAGAVPRFDPGPGDGESREQQVLRRPAELGSAAYAVLAVGLDRQPERRWPTCTTMTRALAEALRSDESAAVAARAEKPKRRGWLYAAIGALVLIAAAIGAFVYTRSQETTATPGVSLSDASIEQGGSLIVTGSKLPPNQVGTVELESARRQIGAFEADQNGNATVRVTIPTNTPAGGHVVSLCWSDACHASAKLTVTERPETPSPSSSPTLSPSPSPSVSPTPSPTPTPTVLKSPPSQAPRATPSPS